MVYLSEIDRTILYMIPIFKAVLCMVFGEVLILRDQIYATVFLIEESMHVL